MDQNTKRDGMLFRNLDGVKNLVKYLSVRYIGGLFLFSLLVSGMSLVPVQILSTLVDHLSKGKLNGIEKIILLVCRNDWMLVGAFGVSYCLAAYLANEYGYRIANYNNRIIEAVRQEVFRTVVNANEIKDASADIITRTVSDIEQITRVVAGPLNGFLQQIVAFTLSVIILCMWSIRIAGITVIVSVLLYYFSAGISLKNKENGKLERLAISQLSVNFADVINNHPLVRSYQMNMEEQIQLEERSKSIFSLRKQIAGKMKWYWGAVSLVDALAYSFIFWILLYDIKYGNSSVGQILAIYVYTEKIFSAMISISRYKTDIYNSDAALSRVFAIIRDTVEKTEKIEKGENCEVQVLRLENISLKYGDRLVLNNVNIEAKRGEMFALEGESGAGKSSLLNLLVNDIDGMCGKVFFDNKEVTTDLNLRRRAIRVCFQEPMLFHNTLGYNLNYGVDKIYEYANKWQKVLLERILSERGEEFVLDDKKGNLSGGEKRRIAIARTINVKVPIYIFDEPTAELDEENRDKVLELLNELKRNSIIVVASHDEKLLSEADRVYKL